jgi:hypothetical protein
MRQMSFEWREAGEGEAREAVVLEPAPGAASVRVWTLCHVAPHPTAPACGAGG